MKLHLPVLLVAALLASPLPAPAQVTQDPELVASRLMVRAMTRSFLEDHEGALGYLEEVLKLRPQDPTVMAALAQTYLDLGNENQAAFYAERAVLTAPDRPENQRLVAELRQRSGDTVGSLDAWDSVLELQPNDLSAQVARARLLKALEQRSASLDAYRAAAELGPLPAEVLEEYLDVQMSLGQLEDALQTVSRLDGLAPNADHLLMQGGILIRLGRMGEAAQSFARALERRPGDSEALEALAEIDPESAARLSPTAGDDPVESARQLVRAAQSNLRDLDLRMRAIDASLSAGLMPDAVELAEDGLLFFPGHEGMTARAIDAYLHALKLDLIARAIAQLGPEARVSPIFVAAQAAADRVSSGTINAPPVPDDNRGRTWAVIAGAVVKVDPDPAIPSSRLAAALALGSPAEAARSLETDFQLRPASPLELLFLGDLLNASGRRAAAESAWKQALEGSPSNPLVQARFQ